MSCPRPLPQLVIAVCLLLAATLTSAEPFAPTADGSESAAFSIPPLAELAKLPLVLSQDLHGELRETLARQTAEMRAQDERTPRSVVFRTQRTGPVFQPTAHARPVHGAMARSEGIAGLGFWAAGTGFAVGRRSAGYGVECGAALPVGDTLGITAGYRIAGFARGDRLDGPTADVEERVGAPFVGLDVRF